MGSGDDGEGELAAWCTQAAAAAEFSGPPEELEDGLTQFDVRRPPIRARPPGFETVTIPLKALNNEFRCPVCLGILRESSTTMECLHRFCNDCITKKKECPACRYKCASRRSLRADDQFGALISTLYPNLDELDALEDQRVLMVTELRGHNALAHSLEQALQRQQEAAGRVGKSRNASLLDADGSAEKPRKRLHTEMSPRPPAVERRSPSPTPGSRTEGREVVDFTLSPHVRELTLEELPGSNIRTSLSCTVQHLLTFVHLHVKGDGASPPRDYRITLAKKGKTLILPSYLSLRDILEDYWRKEDRMTLHYSLSGTDLH